jgi:glutamate formiminotransferase/formiminotetrahydrofolate cyclodeaminase
MEDCIALARALGARVGHELAIPVYLYERAATRPDRVNLADVRRGGFERLRDEIARDDARIPDFGPRAVHERAGATVIGARPYLIAYNVYLGPAANLPIARTVARAVRGSSGGLPHVKALGLAVDGQAQVSMNLVDHERTPLHRAFEAVRTEAATHGVAPTWSELVGLIPERALLDAGAHHVQLRGFRPQMLLEHQLREAVRDETSLSGFVASVAAPSATPGGGSVAAHAGALGAALAQMVAGVTVGKTKYAAVEGEMREAALQAAALGTRLAGLVARDAQAYAAVTAAYKLPKQPEHAARARERAIHDALLGAAAIPLETARAAAEVAELAAACAERGNANAVSDAGVAALLADAACRGAANNVRINVAALQELDRPAAAPLVEEARALVARARAAAERAQAAVERAIGA